MNDLYKTQSCVIDFLRFPMIFAVVIIHSIGYELFDRVGVTPPVIYSLLIDYTVDGFCRIAVPLFFMISGYLFFSDQWNIILYGEKLKKRARSLLLPYILSITITMVIIGLLQYCMPFMLSGDYKPVYEYGVKDFLLAYWKMDGTNIPYIAPLWFVRNLMVVMVFSPIVYHLIKWCGALFPFTALAVWAVDIDNIYTFMIPGTTSISFFSLGAFFRIKHIDFVASFSKYTKISLILYPLLLGIRALFTHGTLGFEILTNVSIPIGIICAINIARLCVIRHISINKKITAATFFIYAFHVPYIGQIAKLCFILVPNESSVLAVTIISVILQVGLPILITIILIMIYNLICRITPKFAAILVGNRS